MLSGRKVKGAVCPDPSAGLSQNIAFRAVLEIAYISDLVPAKKQSDGCKTSYDSAANFPVTTQTATKGIQSLDQIGILLSEFFLCDRKDGLASMEMFHKEIHCLFLHLQSRHLSPSYSFSSGPRLFPLKMNKYLLHHPVEC